MSNNVKNRHAAVRAVHKMYRKSDAGLNGKCVYCGKYADTLDHIPPVSIAVNLRRDYLAELDPVLVPACRHCNSVIGASEQIKLVDRRDIVANHLYTKKSRMLEFGKKLVTKNLTVLHDWRDAACVDIFERWEFASLSQNEVEEIEPDELPYERATLVKGIDRADLTIWQLLSTWGLSDAFINEVTSDDLEDLRQLVKGHSYRDQQLFQIFATTYPMRGPFSWLANWSEYANLIFERFPMDVDQEEAQLKFKRVKTARVALRTVMEILSSCSVIPQTSISNYFDTEIGVPSTLETRLKQIDSVKKLRKLLEQSDTSSSDNFIFVSTPDDWPFSNGPKFYHEFFIKNQKCFEDVAYEYRFVRREVARFEHFENFMNELPTNFHKNVIGKISNLEFYVTLLLHSWVVDSVSRPLLFKINFDDYVIQ